MSEHPTIDYAAVLADLERKRDELDRAIAAIRPFAGQGDTSTPPTGGGSGAPSPRKSGAMAQLRSDEFFGMKAPEAIQKYLAIAKGPRTVRDIVDALRSGGFITSAKDLYNNIYTALIRLEKDELVRKLPDSTWGLAEWYPALPKKRVSKAENDGAKDPDASGDDEETAA